MIHAVALLVFILLLHSSFREMIFHINKRPVIMDVVVERSRGDGCESERSAASGDERNRPQRRPIDDNGWR
jgi:hypothetical protein